jgi:REP element-mobilizing transposase RayT
VAHAPREAFRAGCPVHVTLRIEGGLPSLRRPATYRALVAAMGGGSERFGMRLVHWSVMSNHLHMLVEASGRAALSRGMQGLAIRLARSLNSWWGRSGRVFADRFHGRALRSPREVRAALHYVLANARRHGIATGGPDPYSSAPWFDGWRDGENGAVGACAKPDWLRRARTWLLESGWRRRGLLDWRQRPAGP